MRETHRYLTIMDNYGYLTSGVPEIYTEATVSGRKKRTISETSGRISKFFDDSSIPKLFFPEDLEKIFGGKIPSCSTENYPRGRTYILRLHEVE